MCMCACNKEYWEKKLKDFERKIREVKDEMLNRIVQEVDRGRRRIFEIQDEYEEVKNLMEEEEKRKENQTKIKR